MTSIHPGSQNSVGLIEAFLGKQVVYDSIDFIRVDTAITCFRTRILIECISRSHNYYYCHSTYFCSSVTKQSIQADATYNITPFPNINTKYTYKLEILLIIQNHSNWFRHAVLHSVLLHFQECVLYGFLPLFMPKSWM